MASNLFTTSQGFKLTPSPPVNGVNSFFGADRGEAETARDSHFSSNPSQLPSYVGNPFKLIVVSWGADKDIMSEYQNRENEVWVSTFNQTFEALDLSTQSVTALSDISSAGSGAIIEASERIKLSLLETAPIVSEFYIVDSTTLQAVTEVNDINELVSSFTSTFNVTNSSNVDTGRLLLTRPGANVQTVLFDTFTVKDTISSATFSVSKSQADALSLGSGELSLTIVLFDSTPTMVSQRDAGNIQISPSARKQPPQVNTAYLNTSSGLASEDTSGDNRSTPFSLVVDAFSKIGTYPTGSHKQIVVDEESNLGSINNDAVGGTNVPNCALIARASTINSLSSVGHAIRTEVRKIDLLVPSDKCELGQNMTLVADVLSGNGVVDPKLTFSSANPISHLYIKIGTIASPVTIDFSDLQAMVSGSFLRIEVDRYEGDVDVALTSLPKVNLYISGWIGEYQIFTEVGGSNDGKVYGAKMSLGSLSFTNYNT